MSVFRSITGFFTSLAGETPPPPPPPPPTLGRSNLTGAPKSVAPPAAVPPEHQEAPASYRHERAVEDVRGLGGEEEVCKGVAAATTSDDSSVDLSDSESTSTYSPSTEENFAYLGIDTTLPVDKDRVGVKEVGGSSEVGLPVKVVVSKRTPMEACLARIEPPDIDLSHLNEEERLHIAAVMAKARLLNSMVSSFTDSFDQTRYAHIVCQYARYAQIGCQVCTHCMPGMHPMYARYAHIVCQVCTHCMPVMHTLYARYARIVCQVCTLCMPVMHTLYARYAPIVCQVCTHCMPGMHALYAMYAHIVCQVCTHCMPGVHP